MKMTKLADKTFKSAMVREGSWGSDDIGTHKSTMTLYSMDDERGRGLIEWDIPSLETVVEIGLSFDIRRNLLDYDGTFSLPKQAVELIREAGFTVGEEFE